MRTGRCRCVVRAGITPPPLKGLGITIPGHQDPFVLADRTNETLVVQGYSSESYLRFDAKGVWMNQRSPNRWLARPDWNVGSPLPAATDPKAAPQWKPHVVHGSLVYFTHDQPLARPSE